MNCLPRIPRGAALVAAGALAAALLAACGGGGGGGTSTGTPTPGEPTSFAPSSTYAGQCSLADQKRFVRSYLDEVYLWYREVPQIDPTLYGGVADYFHALLVTTPDANGLPKDRHSSAVPIAQAASATSLLAAQSNAVPQAKVVTSPAGRRSGYIQFNDHAQGAQDDLIDAFRQVRDAGVQDLVLDLRVNGGGFLYIALAAASMVTSPASDNLVFESLRYNDKRDAESADAVFHFSGRLQYAESRYPRGTQLPQLGLKRLYVLATGATCSSSESIINSLRGIDVEVILIGQTTCGKPFGFHRQDNCGYAYFPIEFQGYNAKGFGDYTAGMLPTCRVADNPAVLAGSATDPLLNAALSHMDSGACPAGTAGLLRSAAPTAEAATPRLPAWAGRVLRAP